MGIADQVRTAAAQDNVVITTLGTCRIADPIIAAARLLPMKRHATGIYGFLHTTKEILQQIDRLEGREIPQEFVRLVASAEYGPAAPPIRPACFLVEVSSLKEIHFDGLVLQINCLDRIFQGRRELFDALFQHKYASELTTRAERLAALPSFAQADPVEQRVLLEAVVHMTTKDELTADLAAIKQRLPGPMVVCSHIDLPDATGKRHETRSRLCGWLREICAEQGFRHFDPSPCVTAYGRERALAERGADINHYSTEFKSVLGITLYELAALEAGAPAKPAAPAPALVSSLVQLPSPVPSTIPIRGETGTLSPPPALKVVAKPVAEPAGELRTTITEVKARIGRGEMEDAEVLLRAAAIDHPGSVEVHTLLGAVAYHRGDSTSALADLKHALVIDPHATEPKILLVKISQRLNRLEEACTQAAELIDAVPNDAKALTVAAKAFTKAKRFQQASAVWRRLALLREHQPTPLVEAARCELKGRNYEMAIEAAQAALSRSPDELAALTICVEALQRLKRIKEMAEVVLRIAAIDPPAAMAAVPTLIAASHHEEAARVIAAVRLRGHEAGTDPVMQAGLIRSLTQRARAAGERGEIAAAGAAWSAIQSLDPGNRRAVSGIRKLVSPLMAKMRSCTQAGEQEAALDCCRRALELDPLNVRLLRAAGQLHERGQQWIPAAQSWERLAEQSSDDATWLLRAARAAGRGERPDEALRIYARLDATALAGVASRVASLTRRLVRAMRDDFAEARYDEAVGKAVLIRSIDPASVPADSLLRKAISTYRRQLKLAVAEENLPAQEACCLRMIAIDPSRADALRVLARVYGNARRWREGIDLQERLARLQPDDPRHWRKLASLCRSAGNYETGVSAALKAVELEPANTQSLGFLSELLNRQALAA